MRLTTSYRAALFAATLLFPAATFSQGKRIALVIGNGDYAHVPALANPKNDSREVAALLKNSGYEVNEVRDGGVKQMGVALRAFALAGRTTEAAVFYFAGHGFEVEGKNYLAPVDAELAINDSLSGEDLDASLDFALDAETLSLEEVLDEMSKVSGLKVIVLDCCRDNPFARTRTWARTRSGSGGLAQVAEAQLPEGTMLVFSGEPGQAVPDGNGDHSPFAEALLQEMRGAAGAPVLKVFTEVATNVKSRQKPWIKFDGTGQSLHAFATVALMTNGLLRDDVVMEKPDQGAEIMALREALKRAEEERAAAQGSSAAEKAMFQKELEEARAKLAASGNLPLPASPNSSAATMPSTVPTPATVSPSAATMARSDPLPATIYPFGGTMDNSIKVSEFTFTYGKPWVRQQAASSMRAGQFLYDHSDESLTDIELVIFFFGAGGGGGTQANIDRWLGQFDGTPKSKTEEREIGGKRVTFLTARGAEGAAAFSSGSKTRISDYTMLAAILPSEQGDVFIKVTGPTKSVEAMKDAFDAFIGSPFKQ